MSLSSLSQPIPQNATCVNASSYRIQHRFWLDVTNPGERELDETVHQLKRGRQFTRTIRDGIRLIVSLRRGEVDVLLELFPWIDNVFANRYSAPVAAATTKQLPASTKKTYDEPVLEIKSATNSADNNATWNFMIASAATVYGNFDSLTPECFDYGVRTGRIPADAIKRKNPKTESTEPKGPKQMKVNPIEAPDPDSFELDDDLLEIKQ